MTFISKIGFGPKVEGEIVVNDFVPGKISVFTTHLHREQLEKAGLVGILGLAVPSIHFRDFDYLRKLSEFPLLVLSKFGNLDTPKELIGKLEKLRGRHAELNGHELKVNP